MNLELQDAPAVTGRAYMPKGKRQDWRTPADVLELVRSTFGGRIDLDPCSNPTSLTEARREVWFKYDGRPVAEGRNVLFGNGLALRWEGAVFVNPPFDCLTRWVRKCRGEHELHQAEVLLLVPARVDTRWWHAHVPSAAAVCLWRGRLEYLPPEGVKPKGFGAVFPTAFIYWGPHHQRFREAFGLKGMVFRP